MIGPEPRLMGIVLPLSCMDAFRYRWHHTNWFPRAAMLGLGLVAVEQSGVDVDDLQQEWKEMVEARNLSRSREATQRCRELERKVISRFGKQVKVCVRAPFIESTAERGRFVARQQMDGDIWTAVPQTNKETDK